MQYGVRMHMQMSLSLLVPLWPHVYAYDICVMLVWYYVCYILFYHLRLSMGNQINKQPEHRQPLTEAGTG